MADARRRPTPRRRLTRIAALLAATAVFAVSVQASVLEACGLCPVDCPMHAQHDHDAEKASAPKMRCHGAQPEQDGGDLHLRRPPCRTSMTLSASLLPPFVLAVPLDESVFFPSTRGAGAETRVLSGRDGVPDTPPPIAFA